MTKAMETEITIYAKIGDYSGLEQATSQEIHAQYEYRLPENQGRQRVRATTVDGTTLYTQTIKKPVIGDHPAHINEETTTEISEEYYQAWLDLFRVKGVNKVRYTFVSKTVKLKNASGETSMPPVKFEVDVFFDEQGNKSKWCKIDIELDKLFEYLGDQHPTIDKVNSTIKISDLPFKPEHAFLGSSDSPEHQAAIKNFWDKFSYMPKAKTSTE